MGTIATAVLILIATTASAAEFESTKQTAKIDGAPVEVYFERAVGVNADDWKALPLTSYPGAGQSLPELAGQHGASGAAVNANFYREDRPGEQEPIGLVVHEGRMLSFPSHYYPSIAFLKGKLEWDLVTMQASAEVDTGAKKKLKQKLCRMNGRASRGCVAFWFSSKLPAGLKNLVYLKRDNGDAMGVVLGKKTYAVSAEGGEGTWALQWPESVDLSAAKTVTIDAALKGDHHGKEWQNAKEAVSGSHILLPKKSHPPLTRSWAIARQPRTFTGVTNDGKPFLAVFDGRRDDSRGASVQDAWTYLQKNHGAAWALNLDGGGSTTLFRGSSLINKPSDRMPRPIAVGWGAK